MYNILIINKLKFLPLSPCKCNKDVNNCVIDIPARAHLYCSVLLLALANAIYLSEK